MSGFASFEDEKYVNGCRLSSSLLELQPFKVVVAEAKSITDKDKAPRRHSHNNNNHYKDRRAYSTPGFQVETPEPKQPSDSSDMPLLSSDGEQNRHGASVSCDNIFDSPTLQVKLISNSESGGQTPNRSASADYDPVSQGNSLPKPILRTASKERLLVNDSPNHVTPEQRKTKPKKPNRESLRRSRQDIRASHPNLQNANRSSVPPSGSTERNKTSAREHPITPMHDYEELPTDVKILQQRQKISQPQSEILVQKVPPQEIGFTPIAFQSQTSPAVPERTKNPRQRLNPLYAGMHMNPYEQQTANGNTEQKRPPTRCLRCLVAGVITAVLFSLISVAAVSLMILGYLEPVRGFAMKNTYQSGNDLISRLESEILALRNSTGETQAKIDERLKQTKFELVDAVKSLNLSALKGPNTADVANCVHMTFGIGSSSTQDEITSGEYFAEKGFVTTGVTCSASTGYVAYLHTREEDVDGVDEYEYPLPPRVIYNCVCHKSPKLAFPAPGERVECSIHYWQCPIL